MHGSCVCFTTFLRFSTSAHALDSHHFQMHPVFVSAEKEQQEAIEHIDEVQNEIDR